MITDSNQACLAKMTGRRLQEEADTRFEGFHQIKPFQLIMWGGKLEPEEPYLIKSDLFFESVDSVCKIADLRDETMSRKFLYWKDCEWYWNNLFTDY